MRRALTALLTIVALLAVAAPALGATVTTERAQQEIDQSRVLLGRSLEALKAGRPRQARTRSSRAAYLDHFEFVEIPLRLRNPNLVLDTEFKFAKLRNDIRDGAPIGDDPRPTRPTCARGCVDVDRELASKGFAAPLVAFGFSFSILFREGVEAVLLLAILLGSLAAGSARELQAPARAGRRSRRSSRPASCCCSRRS